MANYIVSDTNLTAVANAIRTKGGTSEQLEFPDGFVSAIGDIQTGGGVTVEALSVTENGTYTAPTGKAYSPVTVNVSGGGTDDLLLLEQGQLTTRTSTATSISNYAFYDCSNLTSVSFPTATSIGSNAFYGCSNLTSVSFPTATSISNYAFYGCTTLNVLVLRKSDDICTLSNTNAFNNTPFASNGTGGTLYVPQDLIARYQSANRWSTILGYANNQIKAIEGSIYE